jgi:hypothetical protein
MVTGWCRARRTKISIKIHSVRLLCMRIGTESVQPSINDLHIVRRTTLDPQLGPRSYRLALTQIWCNSDRTDRAGLEEIDFSSAVHLTFDELELGDLTFGLSIRSWQGDRGADRSFVFGDTAGEA